LRGKGEKEGGSERREGKTEKVIKERNKKGKSVS